MDNGAHRENGRPKPPQGQHWVMQQQPSMKQIMSIMAERDAAIQERNLALSEKKLALSERDMAIQQRDSAITERNNAMMERENAIATLQYQKTSGVKHMHMHHHRPHIENPSYNNSSEIIQDISEPMPPSPPPPEPKKPKRTKEPKADKKPVKKKVKRERDEFEEGSKTSWKDQNLGLNQVAYDDSTMPVPVCSCTGVYRPCYKWGSGGWQSSCCTTTLSQYPLPQVPNKRHARIGGRKMSGGAFNKLLSRLAADGHDLSNPVDLKDNWAKHGTNRYITIK